MTCSFSYGITNLERLRMLGPWDGDEFPNCEIGGEVVRTSKRFWDSFFRRQQLSRSVLSLYDFNELTQRIADRKTRTAVRYTIERPHAGGSGRLLGLSSPQDSYIGYDDAVDLFQQSGAIEMDYDGEGLLTSTQVPSTGEGRFKIGPDDFEHRYVVALPVDGYGRTSIYLGLLRLVCSNGMVGWSKTFRSELENAPHAVERALSCFSNSDGYCALHSRLEMAQRSWASVHEMHKLYRLLAQLRTVGAIRDQRILVRYEEVTGNVHLLYGVANFDALASKQQRTLPVQARVYDLINFASEVGKSVSGAHFRQRLHAYLGDLLSRTYDLEGTGDSVVEFADFFTK